MNTIKRERDWFVLCAEGAGRSVQMAYLTRGKRKRAEVFFRGAYRLVQLSDDELREELPPNSKMWIITGNRRNDSPYVDKEFELYELAAKRIRAIGRSCRFITYREALEIIAKMK